MFSLRSCLFILPILLILSSESQAQGEKNSNSRKPRLGFGGLGWSGFNGGYSSFSGAGTSINVEDTQFKPAGHIFDPKKGESKYHSGHNYKQVWNYNKGWEQGGKTTFLQQLIPIFSFSRSTLSKLGGWNDAWSAAKYFEEPKISYYQGGQHHPLHLGSSPQKSYHQGGGPGSHGHGHSGW